MTLAELLFTPQGTAEMDLKSFDCGRESVNTFPDFPSIYNIQKGKGW